MVINLLSDILTYIRRIIKSPNNDDISDALLIDYVNRFWIMDVSASMQLFDLKTKYSFQTTPGIDRYNMPLYDIQTIVDPGNPQNDQIISYYPVYQGFLGPAYIDGVQVQFTTLQKTFYNTYPKITQYATNVSVGNGTTGPYTLQFPVSPGNQQLFNTPINALLRGNVDITGVIANAQSTGTLQDPIFGSTLNMNIPSTSIDSAIYFTSQDAFGNNVVVQDSGQFLLDSSMNRQINYGLLMTPGNAPFGYSALSNGSTPPYSTTQNTINYLTGVATNVYFPVAIPLGVNINAQCLFFQSGLPRTILYYNSTLVLRNPPAYQYLVELDAYLTPAAFLNTTQSIQFAYMSEYIARGAARKIMSDTGDIEQLNFYEKFFLEQEALVHIRSQRQFTSTRTPTIYSQGMGFGGNGGIGQQGGTVY